MITERPKTRPAFHEMIATASDWFGVQPFYLRYACKRPRVVSARDMVIWNASKSGYSVCEIAQALNKHHTTIMHSRRKMGISQ